MYIPAKFKLNKLVDVQIPEPRSYFSRYGYNSMPSGAMSGDEQAPVKKNKVDTFADMEAYDRMKQAEEDSK